MNGSTLCTTATCRNYRTPLYLALIAAGLAGNYFKFPLFLNIDFLFGSIFAIVALQFFGLGRGIVAAAIISSYTYLPWNHPYAIIIMTAEVAIVGWLTSRHKRGMVLTDTLYWLFIGMPLVYLFYHVVMHVPSSNTYIVMIKQAVNGIANALIARLIFSVYVFRSHSLKISYREIVYNLLTFFVLCPALIMLAVSSRTDFAETDRKIRTSLFQDRQRLDHYLDTWVEDRKTAILSLADMAVWRPPHQMQSYLELAQRSDVNFMRIGLLDRDATTIAYFPLIDELGHNTIGKNYADRPYVPQLKQALIPMLSDVVMGRVGISGPIVMMLVPVIKQGEYGGYVSGIMNLTQVRAQLDKSTDNNAMLYTLIDKNGSVILTNRSEQKVLTRFDRGKGKLNRLDEAISQWVPDIARNTPVSEQWKNSFYVTEASIGDMSEWKLILEQPVAPLQKLLYDNYTGKLTLLFFIVLGALALSELLSRLSITPLEKLRSITRDLPIRVASGATIIWPECTIEETTHLITNFQEMSASIQQYVLELKLANDSLEQRTLQVEQLAHEQQFILTTMPIGASFLKDRKVQVSNPAFDHIFGYETGTTTGQDTSVFYPDNETYERVGKEAYAAIANGGIFTTESVMKKKDGSHIWCSITGRAINHEKLEDGSIWMLQDITERRQGDQNLLESNRLFNEAREQAELANRAKSDFLSRMSHELRTPMNAIIGFTQLLEDDAVHPLSDDQQDSLHEISKAGSHLLELINEVLDLARIESGRLVLSLEPVEPGEVCHECHHMLMPLAEQHGVTLTINVPSGFMINTDRLRFRQIMLNLISNGIKYNNDGGSVEVTCDVQSDNCLRIRVRDTGPGIDPEFLPRLFQPFERATAFDGLIEGTGIGLALSKRLIEAMGGTIGVETSLGSGTLFWIDMSQSEHREQTGALPDASTILLHVPQVHTRQVLYIEDNPANMRLVKKIMSSLGGVNLLMAESAEEGLKLVKTGRPHLILLDINLPGIDGFEALACLRRNPETRDIPVVAVTASAMPDQVKRIKEAGFDECVTKPINLQRFISVVDALLEKPLPEDSV